MASKSAFGNLHTKIGSGYSLTDNAYFDGLYDPESDTIYIQADSTEKTMQQLVEHEMYHFFAAKNPKFIQRTLQTVKRENRAAYDELYKKYEKLYGTAYNNIEGMIAEEMFADIFAGAQESELHDAVMQNLPEGIKNIMGVKAAAFPYSASAEERARMPKIVHEGAFGSAFNHIKNADSIEALDAYGDLERKNAFMLNVQKGNFTQEEADYLREKYAEKKAMLTDNKNGVAKSGGARFSIKRTLNRTWADQLKNHRHDDTLVAQTYTDTFLEGVKSKPMAVPISVVTKAQSAKDASHSVSDEGIARVSDGMKNAPIVIDNPSRNSIVYVTDIEEDNGLVTVAFLKDQTFDGDQVHQATTIHTRPNPMQMLGQLGRDATVYVRKNKLDVVPGSSLLKSGTLNATIKFIDDNIPQTSAESNREFSPAADSEGRELSAQQKTPQMSVANDDKYFRKQMYAENRMRENAKVESLTQEQHDALAEVARLRHEYHTRMDDLFNLENNISDLFPNDAGNGRINEILAEAGLPEIRFSHDMTSDMTYADTWEYDGYESQEDAYEAFYSMASDLNNDIERYLAEIDAEHGTDYAPTGLSRFSLSKPAADRAVTDLLAVAKDSNKGKDTELADLKPAAEQKQGDSRSAFAAVSSPF